MTGGIVRSGAVVAALVWGGCGMAASADVLAGWHFNGLPTPVASSIEANHGVGSLDLSAFGGSGLAWQAGTDLNVWASDPAGEGLGFTGTGANGKSAVFTVGTVGYSSLVLSMAARATGTGHISSVIEAWNGSQWIGAGSFTLTASVWSTAIFELSSLGFLDDGVATVRLRLEGASSAQGNLRIDNVRLEGYQVPAPGSLIAMGAALLTACRRRRG